MQLMHLFRKVTYIDAEMQVPSIGRVLMRLIIFCWLRLQARAHRAAPNIAAGRQTQTLLSE